MGEQAEESEWFELKKVSEEESEWEARRLGGRLGRGAGFFSRAKIPTKSVFPGKRHGKGPQATEFNKSIFLGKIHGNRFSKFYGVAGGSEFGG